MCRPLIFCGAVCVGLNFASHPIVAAGLPEPPLVIYGQLRDNSADARITSGTLTWTWTPTGGGNPVVVSTVVTNVNDQFSFVLFVPCESEISGIPVSANTLRLPTPGITYTRSSVLWNGQPVTLRNAAQATVTISPATRGRIERLDLGLGAFPADGDGDGLPDWSRESPGGAHSRRRGVGARIRPRAGE